jgi:hypothetical protein
LGRGRTLQPGAPVYVIGYPQPQDSGGPRQTLQMTIGSSRPAGKRVQPGYLLSVAPKGERYTHDCFTSPGNAGSPVVELDGGRVIGFHIGGEPATAKGPGIKEAIGFWALAGHPLMVKAGIRVE